MSAVMVMACASRSPATPGDAAPERSTAPRRSAAEVGVETAPLCVRAVGRMIDHQQVSAAQAPMWKRVITTRCVEDRWSADVIGCVADATDAGRMNACIARMSPPQRTALANMPAS